MAEYSDNPIVYELLQACVTQKVKHIVISPGSRNAPLILSFAKHNHLKCYSIVDERVASFFALGLSQQTRSIVALVCTSGTAVLNYAPAVAEAYYQNIPLLILSADRPKELTNQAEGQAINQTRILQNIVEESYELPSATQEYNKTYARRIANEAINLCHRKNRSVHINIPLWEPLYNKSKYDTKTYRPLHIAPTKNKLTDDYIQHLSKQFNQAKRVLIVVGFMPKNNLLNNLLEKLVQEKNAVVLTETIANLKSEDFHYNIDRLISAMNDTEYFTPDLLITCGGTLVSKMIKQWFRKDKPSAHWHINDRNYIIDTFQILTEDIRLKPELFFTDLYPHISPKENTYKTNWTTLAEEAKKQHHEYLQKITWSDLQAFDTLLSKLPPQSHLQLGNSTVVRYHQLFPYNHHLLYASNRGTSGIDGCTSTAVGAAYTYDGFTTLITGDISLRYDSNALWHNYINPKLRIIVINNGGGGIFRFLKESSEQQELEYFFETTHSSNSNKTLAEHWRLIYQSAHSKEELTNALTTFYTEDTRPKILEIFTPQLKNPEILRAYFKAMKTK